MPPTTQHAEMIQVARELQKPLSGLSLLLPGMRGRLLRRIAHLERALGELEGHEQVFERLHEIAATLVKNVKITNKIMAGVRDTTGEYEARVGQFDTALQERLLSIQSLQERGLQVVAREESVSARERKSEQVLADLSGSAAEVVALEQAVKRKLDEAMSLAEQVHLVENKVAGQQVALSQGLSSLQERRERLEQLKLHLQAREEAATKSMNQLQDLAQQKQALHGELGLLRKQCQEELDRGDTLLRERELGVSAREQEVSALGMLLIERERALHERQKQVEERESHLSIETQKIAGLRDDLTAKEQRVAGLQATVDSLEQQRDQLNRALAGLSARL